MSFTKQKTASSWSCSHSCDNWYFYLFESLNTRLQSTFWLLNGIQHKDNGVGNGLRSIKAVIWKRSAEHCIILNFRMPVKCNQLEKQCTLLYYIFLLLAGERKEKQKKPRMGQKSRFGCSSAVATRIRSICGFKFMRTSFAWN